MGAILLNSVEELNSSVFETLFTDPLWAAKLYNSLHPDEPAVTDDDIKILDSESVFAEDLFSHVGFMVKDQKIVFVEAQRVWSPNVALRAGFFFADSYFEHIEENFEDSYACLNPKLPAPELFVICTSKAAEQAQGEEFSLSRDFWDGAASAVDITGKIVREGQSGDAIDQYISFCNLIDKKVELYGNTASVAKIVVQAAKAKGLFEGIWLKKEDELCEALIEGFEEKASRDGIVGGAYTSEVELIVRDLNEENASDALISECASEYVEAIAKDREGRIARARDCFGRMPADVLISATGISQEEFEELKEELGAEAPPAKKPEWTLTAPHG